MGYNLEITRLLGIATKAEPWRVKGFDYLKAITQIESADADLYLTCADNNINFENNGFDALTLTLTLLN